MTFKEKMIIKLTDRGMFLHQAEEVVTNYISEDKNPEMNGRWNESTTSYPEGMTNILWMGLKEEAAKWIEVNAPQAWFRQMFQFSDAELTTMIEKKKETSK